MQISQWISPGFRLLLTIVGIVVTLIATSFTAYDLFIRDHRPALEYRIQSYEKVLDVREDVNNLSVLFQGEDIHEKNQSLSVLGVEIKNSSSLDILKSHYDEESPLGLVISDGRIITAEIVDASNEYLADKLKIAIIDDKAVRFSTVIIEADQSVRMKLLVLHADAQSVSVRQVGKIAGIHSVPVVEEYRTSGEIPFWEEAFVAGPLVQLIRFPAYTVITIAALLYAVLAIDSISEWSQKRARKRLAVEYRIYTDFKMTESMRYLVNCYIDSGARFVFGLQRILSDRTALEEVHRSFLRLDPGETGEARKYPFIFLRGAGLTVQAVEELVQHKLLVKNDAGFSPGVGSIDAISDLAAFLSENGETPPRLEAEEENVSAED